MAKRENGEGSVYKRKDIKRRPWVVALPASYSLDEQGKMIKKQEILGHYASSKEAKAALAHYLEHPVVEINMTVDDLHTLWLSRPEYKNISKIIIDICSGNVSASFVLARELESFFINKL